MRLLQVSKFYWPVMGGIEKVAWELVEGLTRAGVATDVLCSHQRPETEVDQFPGYTVVRAASLGMLLSTSMAPEMLRHMRRMAADSDIVHVHMPDPMAAAAIWAVRPAGRLVVHWHSDVVRQRHAMKFYAPLQNWLLSRADAIVATSEPYAASSNALQAWRSKVEVIPIGISDNCAQGSSEKAAAIRQRFSHRRIVFALGRMTYYKGFEVLIEAAAALPDDCVVLIGGDGELTNIEVVKMILAELGKPESLIKYVTDRLGHDRRYAIDSSKVQQELGWAPKHRPDQGIRETIAWYVQHRAWWEPLRKKA